MSYDRVADGEWFAIPRAGEKIACCDCGLTHRVKVSRRGGRVGVRFWRLPQATGGNRRFLGVKVVKRRRR